MTARPLGLLRLIGLLVAHGVRERRRAPLLWGGGLGAMCALMVAIWPSIEGAVGQLVQSYPSSVLEAFGIERLDSVEAYLDAEMLSLVVPMAIAYFAIRSVMRDTVDAEDRGHLDVLLALPVPRWVVVTASVLATAAVVGQILAVVWVITCVTSLVVGGGLSGGAFAAGLAAVWPLAIAFAGLTACTAGVLHRPGAVVSVAGGALVAMYVIDLAGRLEPSLDAVRLISAFRYYGAALQDGLDLSHVLVLAAAAVVLTALGARRFEQRDLR